MPCGSFDMLFSFAMLFFARLFSTMHLFAIRACMGGLRRVLLAR